MKHTLSIGAALLLGTSLAHAGGLDRSNQPIGVIFEEGDVVQLSFGLVSPEVSGEATGLGLSGSSGDIAETYFQLGAGVKVQATDEIALAVIYDQPFGADVDYGDADATYYTGAAAATVDSYTLTGLAQYTLSGGLSVHGGVRMQVVGAEVSKPTAAGYELETESNTAFGYVAGIAYEKPEIALRVALTYNSAITHDIEGTETCLAPLPDCAGVATTTSVDTPESFNLDFQSGIAADTLLFGSIRHARWSQFDYAPPAHAALGQGSLQSYDDDYTSYSLGLGRKFSDTWSGAVSIGHEPQSGGFAGALGPTDGNTSLGLGGTYTGDGFKITGGVRYIQIGDADVESPFVADTTIAEFRDNSAIAAGFSITRSF